MTFVLYHHPACPFCRKVRLVLSEKNIPFESVVVEPWKRPAELRAINPACEVPVLETPERHLICGHRTICEYINEISTSLYGNYPEVRAETRRLCEWFDDKFYAEVTVYLAGEKIMRRLCRDGSPNSENIRAGKTNILTHLNYVEWLLKRRNRLAGETFSMADITAAAHFSVLDYINEIPWDKEKDGVPLYEETKKWYMRIKSHPSFEPLLADRFTGIMPAPHYADLDF